MGYDKSGIKFKFEDFDGMYSEFATIIDILEDNIVEYDNIIDECDNLVGTSFYAYRSSIVKCKADNQKIIDAIENTQTKFEDIKDKANNNYQPINTARAAELDINVLTKSVQRVIDILSGEDITGVLQESVETTQWIVDRKNELDDTFLEALLNPVDERRQEDAEKIFRDNNDRYDKAIENLREDIMFHDEIDGLESYLKKIGKFDELFDNMKEESLFNAYAVSVVGYNTEEFKDIDTKQYEKAELDSTVEASKDKGLKKVHMLLDIGGLLPIPLVSQVCDLANAAIYALEGDWGNAALSAFSAIPIAGSISGLAKYGDEVIGGLGKAGKKLEKVSEWSKTSSDFKTTLSNSIDKYENLDKFLDNTLKPLVGIGAGLEKDSEYDIGMSGAGLASSNAFGWIEELEEVKNLDLFKILLN